MVEKTNEEVRELAEAQVRAEKRASAYVKAHTDDPDPIVRFEWPIWTRGNRKDSLVEVELVHVSGKREFMAPCDMPDAGE